MNEKRNIICFGEMLWDCYPNEIKPGGAPLNVAAHLAQLGNQATILSKVGEDKLGEELIAYSSDLKVDCSLVQRSTTAPTGQVLVQLTEKGIPSYDILEPAAWDSIQSSHQASIQVSKAAALVYGSLASRSDLSRNTLLELLKVSQLNICDLNIRQQYYSRALIYEILSKTHILKINEDEAVLLAELFELDPAKIIQQLTDKFMLDMIILTLGSKGAEVFHKGILYKAQTYKIVPVDTVGSGDAFLATFIDGLLRGKRIETVLDAAMRMGAYVATQKGAIPDHNYELIAELKKA